MPPLEALVNTRGYRDAPTETPVTALVSYAPPTRLSAQTAILPLAGRRFNGIHTAHCWI